MGFWEDRAKQFDKMTRGPGADTSKTGTGLARRIDNMATGAKKPVASKPKGSGPKPGSIADRVFGAGVGVKKSPPKAAAAAASRRSSTPSNATDAKRAIKSSADKGAAKRAAERKSDTESRMKSRGNRIQSKDYKGKYWGPDQFKGNQAKIDAWKKSGKQRNSDGSPKV